MDGFAATAPGACAGGLDSIEGADPARLLADRKSAVQDGLDRLPGSLVRALEQSYREQRQRDPEQALQLLEMALDEAHARHWPSLHDDWRSWASARVHSCDIQRRAASRPRDAVNRLQALAKRFGISIRGSDAQGIIRRAVTPHWWIRQGRHAFAKACERTALHRGLIDCYISPTGLALFRTRARRSSQIL